MLQTYSSKEWDFDPNEIMDYREIVYEEALEKCRKLEDDLALVKLSLEEVEWLLEDAKEMQKFWKGMYEKINTRYYSNFSPIRSI